MPPATATARRSASARREPKKRSVPARRSAAARTAAPPRRSTPAKRPPARRTTPARRAAPTHRRGVTPTAGFLIPVAVGQRTATAVGGLADSGLVFRLTRGRLWILAIGALLVGIVALNVVRLSFSAEASRMAGEADAIERETSALRAQLAAHGSSDKIEKEAAQLGLVVPSPDAISYLEPDEDDTTQAARRLREGELGW